jgi:hypothetical protein
VLGVEEQRIGRERRRTGVLDALIHRQNRQVSAASEATVTVDALQVDQDARLAVGGAEDVADVIGTRQVNVIAGNPLAGEIQKIVSLVTKVLGDSIDDSGGSGNGHEKPSL